MNMHTPIKPSLAEAHAAYAQAVKTERALRADGSTTSDEIGKSLDREQAALRAYIATPASTPADVIAKLMMLRDLLQDETMWNDAPPLDREYVACGDTYDADMIALIDGIVSDVYSGNAGAAKSPIVTRVAVLRSRTRKSPRPPASVRAKSSSPATTQVDMDAFDELTLKLFMLTTFANTTCEAFDANFDRRDNILQDPQGAIDAVESLRQLAIEAKEAAERATSKPAVAKAAAS